MNGQDSTVARGIMTKNGQSLCSGDVRTISWYNAPKKIWRSSNVGKMAPPPPPELSGGGGTNLVV